MTSRERILAAVRREPVGYVRCCVVFNPLTPVQRQGHTRNFPWPPDTPYPQQLRSQVKELGLDQVVSCGVVVTGGHSQVTCEVRVEGVRVTLDCFGRTGLVLSPAVSSHSIMP